MQAATDLDITKRKREEQEVSEGHERRIWTMLPRIKFKKSIKDPFSKASPVQHTCCQEFFCCMGHELVSVMSLVFAYPRNCVDLHLSHPGNILTLYQAGQGFAFLLIECK